MKLFDAVVTPTMLYGSGCWAKTTERQRDLRTTQRRMMRMILGTRRKYVGDHETVETYVEWIQRAIRELEIMMDKYGVKDWVTLQRNYAFMEMGGESRTSKRWQMEPRNIALGASWLQTSRETSSQMGGPDNRIPSMEKSRLSRMDDFSSQR